MKESVTTEKNPLTCVQCGKQYELNASLMKHIRTQHSGITYKCRKCGKKLSGSPQLKRHMLLMHSNSNNSKIINCHCGRSFTSVYAFNLHVTQSSPYGHGVRKGRWQCSECCKYFSGAEELSNHVKFQHLNLRRGEFGPCEYCGKYFEAESFFKFHMLFHKPEQKPFYCGQCNKIFISSVSLKVHQENVHSGTNLSDCPDFVGKSADGLEVISVQENVNIIKEVTKSFETQDVIKKEFKCGQCGNVFTSRKNLVYHVRYKHMDFPRKKFGPCPKCGKFYSAKSYFEVHVKSHGGEMPFKCGRCSKVFMSASGVKRHEKIRCRKSPNLPVKPPDQLEPPESREVLMEMPPARNIADEHQVVKEVVADDEIRKYKCGECGDRFGNKVSLMDHITFEHLKLRRKKFGPCAECGKYFSGRANFDSHVLSHTGKKSFNCAHCPRTFLLKPHLASHEKAHKRAMSNLPGRSPGSEVKERVPVEDCEKSASHEKTHRRAMSPLPGGSPEELQSEVKECISESKKSMTFTEVPVVRYSCEECERSFAREVYLKRHILSHTGEQPFRCTECPKAFLYKANLVLHKKAHGRAASLKPKRPPNCEQQPLDNSNSPSGGTVPVQECSKVDKATEEKSLKCHQCSRSFPRMASLMSHERAHAHLGARFSESKLSWKSSGEPQLVVLLERQAVLEKEFSKPIIFANNGSLLANKGQKARSNLKSASVGKVPVQECSNFERITEERPFKCAQCPRDFLRKVNLASHERVHKRAKHLESKLPEKLPLEVPESVAMKPEAVPTEKSSKSQNSSKPLVVKHVVGKPVDQLPESVAIETEVVPAEKSSKSENASKPLVVNHVVGKPVDQLSDCVAMETEVVPAEKWSKSENASKPLVVNHVEKPVNELQLEFHENMPVQKLLKSENSCEPVAVKVKGVYKCADCGKLFYRQHHFKAHMLFHSGNLPFKCEVCPKSFMYKAYLVRHKRTHGKKQLKVGLPVEGGVVAPKEFSNSDSVRKSHNVDHVEKSPDELLQLEIDEIVPLKKFVKSENVIEDYGENSPDELHFEVPDERAELLELVNAYEQRALHHLEKSSNHLKLEVIESNTVEECSNSENVIESLLIHDRENSVDDFSLKANDENIAVTLKEIPKSKYSVCEPLADDEHESSNPLRLNVGENVAVDVNEFSKSEIVVRNVENPQCQLLEVEVNNVSEPVQECNNKKLPQVKQVYKCADCGKCFSQHFDFATHLLIHSGNMPFKCDVCPRSFLYKGILVSHKKTHENAKLSKTGKSPVTLKLTTSTLNENEPVKEFSTSENTTEKETFKCVHCPKTFLNKAKLTSHKKAHVNALFKCAECHGSFASKKDLMDHIAFKSLHMPPKKFGPCPECGKCFARQRFFDTHMISHTGENPFKCSDCPKAFLYKSSLVGHRTVHLGANQPKCPEKSPKQVNVPTEEIPKAKNASKKKNKAANLKCVVCGKCFARQEKLKAHLVLHSRKNQFICTICGKAYLSEAALATHEKKVHEDKAFKCADCGICFPTKEALTEHIEFKRLHLPGNIYGPCPECGKCFAGKTYLEIHIVSHSGKKPFICAQCGKAFLYKASLANHNKVHLSAKPSESQINKVGPLVNFPEREVIVPAKLECAHCGRFYSNKNSLTEHIEVVHLKMKRNWPCQYCKKVFPLKSYLKNHMFSHRKQIH